MDKGFFLVIVDADRIHEYVFTPHQLKLIRGGSALQDQLNRRGVLELLEQRWGRTNLAPGNLRILDRPRMDGTQGQIYEAVYAGGGTTVVMFGERQHAEEFAQSARALYERKTRAATATAAATEWRGGFRETMKAARTALERNKTGRAERRQPSWNPYAKPCEACGLYPAAERERGGSTRLVCEACRRREDHADKSRFFEAVKQRVGGKLKAPQDFEALGEMASPENWLAMVYLDIDRLGKWLDDNKSDSAQEFRHASRAIARTVWHGVVSACAGLCRGLGAEETAPFEGLLVGGDDAIVMLPAQHVFGFLETFKKKFRLRQLTFSAGVVWAHHHYPIAQYVALGEELLKSAKRSGGDSVDWVVVSEAMVGGIGPRGEGPTRKPYPLGEFLKLAEKAREWKKAGFPANKANELYRIAHMDRDQGIIDYYWLLSRLKEEHRDLVRCDVEAEMWTPGEGTGAADLVELWDFVEAG